MDFVTLHKASSLVMNGTTMSDGMCDCHRYHRCLHRNIHRLYDLENRWDRFHRYVGFVASYDPIHYGKPEHMVRVYSCGNRGLRSLPDRAISRGMAPARGYPQLGQNSGNLDIDTCYISGSGSGAGSVGILLRAAPSTPHSLCHTWIGRESQFQLGLRCI